MKVDRAALGKNIEQMKKEGFDYLVKITAVDYVEHVDAIYMIRNLEQKKDVLIEVELSPSDLWLDTIMGYYPAADWYERELQEMFGIKIKGRKAPRLLLEKWDGKGYPLRKSFEWNKPYERSE